MQQVKVAIDKWMSTVVENCGVPRKLWLLTTARGLQCVSIIHVEQNSFRFIPLFSHQQGGRTSFYLQDFVQMSNRGRLTWLAQWVRDVALL